MFILAWRNIWRKLRRSFVTASAVAVVVIITMTFFGFTGAAQNGIYYSATRVAGHLQVHVKDYRKTRAVSDLLIDDDAITSTLKGTFDKAFVQADIVSVLAVPGLIESEGRSFGILLQGLEQPKNVRERFHTEYLQKGLLPETTDVEGIALGEKLALNLQVEIGDTVYMYAPGTNGYGAAAYIVTGIVAVPNSEVFAFSSLLAAQELAAPESINRVEIIFPDFNRSSNDNALIDLQAKTQDALGNGYIVETWSEITPELAGFVGYFNRISLFMAFIFFILAGFLVANTIYLSVMERIREFGVLRALGLRQYKIMYMVLLESILLCFSGAIIGIIVSLLIIMQMSQGIHFPAEITQFLVEQGLPRVFYGSISLKQIVITVSFTLLTATLSALLPAFSAGKLEPVEAMRFSV